MDDLCNALLRLSGGARESRLAQWLHPTILTRVEFLRLMACDPGKATRFRLRFLLVVGGIAILYLAAGLLVMLF